MRSFPSRTGISQKAIFASVMFTILLFCASIPGVKGEVNQTLIIAPGKFTVLNFYVMKGNSYPLAIHANASVNVYLMNQSNAGNYMLNKSYASVYSQSDITELNHVLNATAIASAFGAYSSKNNNSVQVYLIIENAGTMPVNVIILYDSPSMFMNALNYSTKFAVLGAMVYLTGYLFIAWKKNARENQVEKAKVFKGFGLTFMFASINYFVDQVQSWYGKETAHSFYPYLTFRGTLLPFAVLRVDQIVFLTLMLFSDLFMIYQIEMVIGRKKHPFMTIMIGISIILNTMIFFVPGIFDISFIFFALTLVITLTQIIWIYASIMHKVPGKLKFQSISIIVGIMLPIVMALVGGYLYPPNSTVSYIIANSLSFASVFFIKFGLG